MVMVCGRHGIGSSWCIRDGVSFTNSDKMNVYSLTPHLQIGVHHTAIRRLRERTIPRLVTYQPIQGRCNLPFIHGNEVSSLVETLDDECSQPVGKITMQFIHRWSVHIFLDVEMHAIKPVSNQIPSKFGEKYTVHHDEYTSFVQPYSTYS